jgi:hypothetical protein
MEDWTKELLKAVETVTGDMEKFFQEMAQEVDAAFDAAVEELTQLSEDLAEQTHDALKSVLPVDEMAAEFDRALREFFDPIFDAYLELDLDWENSEESDPFVAVTYVPPSASKNPACIGCQNYHGHMYGENLLVCGMYPFGWEGESCPDWQGIDTSQG